MKKALNLQEIIEIQKTLETTINSLSYDIIANNAFEKGYNPSTDVNEHYKKVKLLFKQLNIIKAAKDKGNRKRINFFRRRTNQDNILERSNLVREESLLLSLIDQKIKNRKGKKIDAYDFQISKAEIDDKLTEVRNKLSNIEKSMTKFNKSRTVRVKIFDELNLV